MCCRHLNVNQDRIYFGLRFKCSILFKLLGQCTGLFRFDRVSQIKSNALLVNMQVTYVVTTLRSDKCRKKWKKKLSLYRTTVGTMVFQRFREFHKPERKALYVFITKDTVIKIISSRLWSFGQNLNSRLNEISQECLLRQSLGIMGLLFE